MAATVLADSGFLVALLRRRDAHHAWAAATARARPPSWETWVTCDAVLSEAYVLLRGWGVGELGALLRRGLLRPRFSIAPEAAPILALLEKYVDAPMSFADACLVRMSELAAEPVVLTTDSDFSIYRRHGRKVIPAITPL